MVFVFGVKLMQTLGKRGKQKPLHKKLVSSSPMLDVKVDNLHPHFSCVFLTWSANFIQQFIPGNYPSHEE